MPAAAPVLLWFRQDLRLADNPALQAALARGSPVVPVFILDETEAGRWPLGARARAWLHHSLAALGADIARRGGRLVLVRGDNRSELPRLLTETGADAVYANRGYEPERRRRDAELAARLSARGAELRCFNAHLLHEPDMVKNRQGGPFQVFTPFWRHCLSREVALPEGPGPDRWPGEQGSAAGLPLGELDLLRPDAAKADGWREHWQPGEAGAQRRWRGFLARGIEAYDQQRDFPAIAGTSRLSPHLRWGEISPRQIWHAVRRLGVDSGVFPPHRGAARYLAELGWREFAYHLLHHFPDTPERPKREAFDRFAWREDPEARLLQAWQRGGTGYPIVDAGQRELQATGWMHNRVRMIVASFLVKHLRLPWQAGAAWFWDKLVDADLANNTLGWQWSAGSGADAAPYFRIFNPMTQARRFDPQGEYVRRWVPELAALEGDSIHAPWSLPAERLAAAGVVLGKTYPAPVVDHAEARAQALTAYQTLVHG